MYKYSNILFNEKQKKFTEQISYMYFNKEKTYLEILQIANLSFILPKCKVKKKNLEIKINL